MEEKDLRQHANYEQKTCPFKSSDFTDESKKTKNKEGKKGEKKL